MRAQRDDSRCGAGDSSVTRQEHLEWAKGRAHEYADRGELSDAVASMISDLPKHPEFGGMGTVIAMALGTTEIPRGREAVKRWIDGFN
jgi:hypothetical protein